MSLWREVERNGRSGVRIPLLGLTTCWFGHQPRHPINGECMSEKHFNTAVESAKRQHTADTASQGLLWAAERIQQLEERYAMLRRHSSPHTVALSMEVDLGDIPDDVSIEERIDQLVDAALLKE